ncbi:hypothetical protein GCM10029964_082530 [Kibdelosporangium lantanae]
MRREPVDRWQVLDQAGRQDQRPCPAPAPVREPHDDVRTIPATGDNVRLLESHAITFHIRPCRRQPHIGSDTFVAKQVVYGRGRRIARLPTISHDHRAARPPQHQRGLKTRRPSTGDNDINNILRAQIHNAGG